MISNLTAEQKQILKKLLEEKKQNRKTITLKKKENRHENTGFTRGSVNSEMS